MTADDITQMVAEGVEGFYDGVEPPVWVRGLVVGADKVRIEVERKDDNDLEFILIGTYEVSVREIRGVV